MTMRNCKQLLLSLGVLVALSVSNVSAHPLIDKLLQTYELVGGTDCRKPQAKIPAEPKTNFGVDRRFIDLDGSGRCQIMDVWVDWLNPDGHQRIPFSAIYVFHSGKWVREAQSIPAYFPYTLRNKNTGAMYFVTPISPSDEDADQVVPGGEWLKFSGWDSPEPVKIVPDDSWDDPSPLKQAMAVLLTKRLTPEERAQPPDPQKNLRALVAGGFARAGNRFQPPEKQLPLDAHDLPDLAK